MGVIIETINVVVPVATIESRYPGGISVYEASIRNSTYCSDGYLTRVGFMAPADVAVFMESLRLVGVQIFDGKSFVEAAVVDQRTGPTAPVPWLTVGRYPSGVTVAWLEGTPASPVAIPPDWKLGDFSFIPNEEVADRFVPLASRPGMDVLLDFRTGKEVYIGRSSRLPMF